MSYATSPSSGTVVAHKYRLDREVGRGGMGVVYAATDLTLGRTVALKLLLGPTGQLSGTPGSTTSPEDTARFMREARATASLRGEHVAQVFEAGVTAEGVPFLAMELLHGQDLEAHVAKRGPLPIAEACDLMLQACSALAEAHAMGIVHRDLKPQNFFILPPRDASGPKLKVLDFGISKVHAEADLALTQTTMTMGSPRYMSPEQVRSSKYVDHRADLWALGAVLYEALAGKPLFNETTASALHAQIVADPAVPLRHSRPDAPAELEQVILRCVEKDPNRRFANAIELAQALAPFASAAGREFAGGLLKAHGLPLPPVYTPGQYNNIPSSTPGFSATGHPLPSQYVSGAHPQRPAKKSNLVLWVVVGVSVFAVLAIGFSGLSAIMLASIAPPAENYDEPPEPPSLPPPLPTSTTTTTPPPPSAPVSSQTAPTPPTPPRLPRSVPSAAPSASASSKRKFLSEEGDRATASNISFQRKSSGDKAICVQKVGFVVTQCRPGGPSFNEVFGSCSACRDDRECSFGLTRLEQWRQSASLTHE